MKYRIALLIPLLIFFRTALCAEELKLKNGEVINGKIIKENSELYIVAVKYGNIEIKKSDLLTNEQLLQAEPATKQSDKAPDFLPVFFKKPVQFLKTVFLTHREEFMLFLAGFVILGFGVITKKFILSVSAFALFSYFFYFHLSPQDVKDIQTYCSFMHNETYAMKEFMDKENKSLKIRQFDLVAAMQIKQHYIRLQKKINEFCQDTKNITPPGIFRKFHNKYKALIAEYTDTIEQFIALLGPVKLKELEELYKDSLKYIDKEKALLEDFENTALKNNIFFHNACNCPKHEMKTASD